MVFFCNPKINLGLEILRRRPDGYHDLQSVFYPWKAQEEVLEIHESSEFSLHLHGLPLDIPTETNLVTKIYRTFAAAYQLPPVRIDLLKTVPTGSGLGAGSANAAAALLGLNTYFELDLSLETLHEWALRFGSDIPFFLRNTPQFVTGRGEHLEDFELDLSNYTIEVIFPGIPVSTAEAFAGIQPRGSRFSDLRSILRRPVETWRADLVNDFETPIFARHPSIAQAKNDLYNRGALYASMSGTGSAVFGIFAKS